MFGLFRKSTLLDKLLKQFDALGPDYLTTSSAIYGSGEAGRIFEIVLKLDDPALFRRAEVLLPQAEHGRRRQLYSIMWIIACRLNDAALKQQFLEHYYAEPAEEVARHMRDLIARDSISHNSAPLPFDAFSKALNLQPVSSGIQGELRYLELITACMSLQWHKAASASHLDLQDIAERVLRAETWPQAAGCSFLQPNMMAKIGGRAAHTGIEKNLLAKLARAANPDEQLPFAVALAENFPLQAGSPVTSVLLALSDRRKERPEAIRALAHAPCVEVEEKLISFFDERLSVDLLCDLLRSLGAIKSEKARPQIALQLDHAKRDVRWAALAALPVEGEWVAHWIERLDTDRDPFMKGFALTGLLANRSDATRQAILRFARKYAKGTVSKENLTGGVYLQHAVTYLAGFPEDEEIQAFMKNLPADILTAEPPIEALLTAGLHR